jgi:amino acid adenylation domain-containing protein
MNQSLPNSGRRGVSVIIPAYNSARFLPVAIESVLNQTVLVDEIIVIDDGSTDDTKSVCDRYPTISYIYQENQGLIATRNNGIKVSTGEYLLFFDSDDYLLPQAVEMGLKSIDAHPEVGFVFGNYTFSTIQPDGSYKTKELYDNHGVTANYENILAYKLKLQCACVLFRRAAIDIVGGFEPKTKGAEDYDLYLRVAREFPIYFHGQLVSEYRYHGGNISAQPAAMLINVLRAHSLQLSYVQQSEHPQYAVAYEQGRTAWLKLFGDRLPYEIMRCTHAGKWVEGLGYLRLLLNYDPQLEIVDREIATSAYQTLLAQLSELPIASALAYWLEQLADAPRLLSLPTDRSRLAKPSDRGSSQAFVIEPELSLFSQQQGVTLKVMLLAAVNVLLYRYTNTADILVGMPSVQQIDTELFVNPVVIRTDLSGDPSFQVLLERVQQVTELAHRHQALPFELLLDKLQCDRDANYHPLFQVALVFAEDVSFDQIGVASVTASGWVGEDRATKFDLTLAIDHTNRGLEGRWIYNPDLFDDRTIDRLVGHFQTLLQGMIVSPEQSIMTLPMLTAAERELLLETWNDTQTAYPHDRCIHQLFEQQVEQTPDAIAVVFNEQTLTYRELNHRSNQLAHYLQTLGAQPDLPIGICLERSLETIVGLLGILKAGAAYVPLDPSYPPARLSYMLTDSAVKVLLTQQKLLRLLPAHDARVICLDTDWGQIEQQSQNCLDLDLNSDCLAYVIYTSGSTGTPKGVMIQHRSLVNYLSWCTKAYHVADGEGSIVNSSISFDATITSLFAPLLVGRKVVLLPEVGEIEALSAALCSGAKLSVVKITPAHLEILSYLLTNKKVDIHSRAFIIGGEALSEKITAFWRKYAPVTRLINEYGPTETVVGCCVYEVADRVFPRSSVPIGRPIANTQLYILDRQLQPVPIGVAGELYIGGDGVARGYLNRPELTRSRFIPNPFAPEKSLYLYKTGDLACYLSDGNIDFLGRIDQQVKIRGFRIELGEIEARLGEHPQIAQTTVIVREDRPGDKRLAAYCVAEDPNSPPKIDELRDFMAQQVPSYMVPTLFGLLPTLPLTPNGKVDRQALQAYQPEPIDFAVSHQPLAVSNLDPVKNPGFIARNSTEEMLVTIWSEILGQQQIGINDNFFDLGGNSISIVQVAMQIQSQLGCAEIAIVKLFQYSTIARLADYLNGSQNTSAVQAKLQSRAQQNKAANARRGTQRAQR